MLIGVRNQTVFFPDDGFTQFFSDAVLPLLHAIRNKLGVKYTKITESSIQIAATGNGQFGKIHSDSLLPPYMSRIAFLYYFHQTPKVFSGGDLLIYDTNINQKKFTHQYTRIVNKDNMLIAFPGCFFHEITEVTNSSVKFEDNRFAISFWVTLS